MKLRIAKKVLGKYTIGIWNECDYGDGLYYIGKWCKDNDGHKYYNPTYSVTEKRLIGRINFIKALRYFNHHYYRGLWRKNKRNYK